MPKTLVWTGMHPDEQLALKVGDGLRKHPLQNVHTEVTNPRARERGVRFIDENMMSAIHAPNAQSRIYERRRAVEVLKKSQVFDGVVIDLHDGGETPCTSAIIDAVHGASPQLLGFLAYIGVENLVLSSDMGLQKYVPRCTLIELGKGYPVRKLREGLALLANDDPALKPCKPTDFQWFEWLASLSTAEAHPDKLTGGLESLRPFETFPGNLQVGGKRAYLMTWFWPPNDQNYWGELVVPIKQPNTRNWPKR